MTLDLYFVALENAEKLQAVVWDENAFPRLTTSNDEVILRDRIASDIKGIIKGERMLSANATLLNEQGQPIQVQEPWLIKLSGDERRLRLDFITEQGAELVPAHDANLVTLKKDMSRYLHALEHDGSPGDIGYTQGFDYSRQYQHEFVARQVYQTFKTKDILPDTEEVREIVGEATGDKFSLSNSDWRKRFFCQNPYLPRAIFEFAQHAIAGYDQPFRAELQRRARRGGYDR